MTLPGRRRRTITVEDAAYYWQVSTPPDYVAAYYDGSVDLTIEPASRPGRRLHASVSPEQAGERSEKGTAVVKPELVRRVILTALHQGWTEDSVVHDVSVTI